jgi:hypothetical protein
MNEAIGRAIMMLAEKITDSVKSDDAMRFSQSALNLAHTLNVLKNSKE